MKFVLLTLGSLLFLPQAALAQAPDPDGFGCYTSMILSGVAGRSQCTATTADTCTMLRGVGGHCSFFAPTEAECQVVCDACGNGAWEGAKGEECDDGNNDVGDGCSDTCKLEPVYCCRAGIQRELTKFELEDNQLNYVNYEGNDCINFLTPPMAASPYDAGAETTLDPTEACECGDGIVNAFEECDLGRDGAGRTWNEDQYGCTNQCFTLCGDTIVDDAYVVDYLNPTDWGYYGDSDWPYTEVCDDGNGVNDDGCDNYCQLCGNNQLDGDEDCDLGRQADGTSWNIEENGCTEECKFMCGNGTVDNAYVVEDGGTDWAVDAAGEYVKEVCDDGNLENDDGCDWNCQEEVGLCCVPQEVAEAMGVGIGVARVESECTNFYGGTYNAPDQAGANPITDEGAEAFCAGPGADLYCCSADAPFDPKKIENEFGCEEQDATIYYTVGDSMNLETAKKSCEPVYCEEYDCALHPKYDCNAGYGQAWLPATNNLYNQCITQAYGSVTPENFCKLWIDPNLINDCFDFGLITP